MRLSEFNPRFILELSATPGKEEIREITTLVDLPGFDYDTDEEKLDVEKELSAEFFSRRIFETLPNPYLAAQIVKKMLATLHRQGYTDESIFDRRYHLSEILKRRLTELVEHEAQAVFHRKLQNHDIRFELIADEDGFEFARGMLFQYNYRDEFEKLIRQNQSDTTI